MAAEGSCGDLLALGAPPEPSPAEGRWDSRELAAQIQFSILRGHSDTVSSCHFCYGDTKLLSCSYDKTVELWDVEKDFPIPIFEEQHTAQISDCSLTPDDRRMVTSSYDNTVKAWDMETGKILWTVEHDSIVTSCNISYDGGYVVSSSDREIAIHIFDSVSNNSSGTHPRKHWRPHPVLEHSDFFSDGGHSNAVSDCWFTSNGHYLCTASWDKSLKIWDIKRGEFQCHEPVSLNEGHEGSVSSCVFTQDASHLSTPVK